MNDFKPAKKVQQHRMTYRVLVLRYNGKPAHDHVDTIHADYLSEAESKLIKMFKKYDMRAWRLINNPTMGYYEFVNQNETIMIKLES